MTAAVCLDAISLDGSCPELAGLTTPPASPLRRRRQADNLAASTVSGGPRRIDIIMPAVLARYGLELAREERPAEAAGISG